MSENWWYGGTVPPHSHVGIGYRTLTTITQGLTCTFLIQALYTVIAFLLVCVTHRPKGKDFIYLVGLPTGSLVSATWQQLNCLSVDKHVLAVQRSLSRILFPDDALNWGGGLREPNHFLNPVILCVTQCCVILTPKLDM